MAVIAILYSLVTCGLALYGINLLFLTLLFLYHRPRKGMAPPSLPDADLPPVTIQLPIYNEKYVATRLIDAVCNLDYPRRQLEIQVLDDSTDETKKLIARRIKGWRKQGVDIVQLRRPDRCDYKAGALRYGLERARGDFIAIFDADFVPGEDWLRRVVAHFCQPGSERLGLVQTRWAHLNDDFSPLTRAQALALDGHFGVEQMARAEGGLLVNFNGTAGLWRRSCIEQSGNWSGGTLCEDLDLSYRAQLAGWRLYYDSTIAAPAEIPTLVNSYKRQQFRWAKGSFQVARLLLLPILRGPFSRLQKVEALLHLTAYAVHPLLVMLLLLTLPLLLWGWPAPFASHDDLLAWMGLAGLGAPILYAAAQWNLYGEGWMERYRWMPMLVLLGSGVALSNSQAVFEGLLGQGGNEFRRTPKFCIEGQQGSWKGSEYILGVNWTTVGEIALALYALLCCAVAIEGAQWFTLPFLLIYVLAFGWVAGLSIWQARAGSRGRGWLQYLRWLERP